LRSRGQANLNHMGELPDAKPHGRVLRDGRIVGQRINRTGMASVVGDIAAIDHLHSRRT
jgi:hypothetical protein